MFLIKFSSIFPKLRILKMNAQIQAAGTRKDLTRERSPLQRYRSFRFTFLKNKIFKNTNKKANLYIKHSPTISKRHQKAVFPLQTQVDTFKNRNCPLPPFFLFFLSFWINNSWQHTSFLIFWPAEEHWKFIIPSNVGENIFQLLCIKCT